VCSTRGVDPAVSPHIRTAAEVAKIVVGVLRSMLRRDLSHSRWRCRFMHCPMTRPVATLTCDFLLGRCSPRSHFQEQPWV
jgi:hypothetical protein